MAKTIGDYKKDYADARSRGDAAGMKAANDGANAIRSSMGQATQSASSDIAHTASGGSSKSSSSGSGGGGGGGGSSGGYQSYNGGNSQLDRLIKEQSDKYYAARAAGDAHGMREANDRANQLRNQYGYAAQFANEDIAKFPWQSGSGGGGGGAYSPQEQQYPYQSPQYDIASYQQAMQEFMSQQMAQQQNYYQQLLDEQQRRYDEIQAQQEAAKKAAVEQAVGNLSGQKGTLEQNYQDLYRQLYLDRRMAEKDLPQQMAAMGISGGMTESTALGLKTSYADALRQGEISKQGALSSLDQAINNARLTGDISIAEQAAQTAKDRLASYGSVVNAMQGQQNWAQQFGYQQFQDALSQQNWGQQFGYQQALDNRNFNYQQSLTDWQHQYQTGRDQVEDKRYEDETVYQKQQDSLKWAYQKDSDAYDRALTKWQLTGVLDAKSALVLGLPVGTKTTDYAYQLAQIAKMSASGSSGGGSGGGSGRKYSGGGSSGGSVSSGDPEPVESETPNLMVDTQSVLALGYGPISAERLAELEQAGEIESYVEGNRIRYRKTEKATGSPLNKLGLEGLW